MYGTGKQTVYHAIQKVSDNVSLEALAALGREIETLQDELSTIKVNEKKARAALAALDAKPRLSTLREDIRRLQEERDAAQTRLGKLYGNDQPQISAEARAQLERDWKQWQRHATVRRRICRELWGCCSEVLPEDTTAPELWVSHRCHTLSRHYHLSCEKCGSEKHVRSTDQVSRSLWGLRERSNESRSGTDA